MLGLALIRHHVPGYLISFSPAKYEVTVDVNADD
jgi:hypothetical protein